MWRRAAFHYIRQPCNSIALGSYSLHVSLVTLRTFDTAMDANLLKSRLESEGIMCFLFDENTLTMQPLLGMAMGGIKLKVAKSELERALHIVEQLDSEPWRKEDNTILTCPRCDSADLYSGFRTFEGITGAMNFLLAILFFVWPFHSTRYRCKQCGKEFKDNSTK